MPLSLNLINSFEQSVCAVKYSKQIDLMLTLSTHGTDIDVTIGGRDIEDIYDDACEKLNEHNAD